MERTMNFYGLNKLNVVLNAISANFFPLTGKKEDFGLGVKIYMIVTWLFEITYVIVTTAGLLLYVPLVIAIQDSGINTIVSIETYTLVVYLNSRRQHLHNLIRMINSILVKSDILERCINDTVEPYRKRLQIYTITVQSSVVMWAGVPLLTILEKDRFSYDDYTIPTYLPGEPFSVSVFVYGLIFQVISVALLVFKKIAIEVYISYLITIVTAEYKYVREQITAALSRDNSEQEEVIASLKKCVQHHSILVETGQMLAQLLSVNVGLTYICCIVRFCLCGFSTVTVEGYIEKSIYVSYMIGNLVQVYMLCSCVQELLEVSTSMTDDAFHENWYERGNQVKSMFRAMGASCQMECRITAFRIIDFTVPTFSSILNKAYSACLLLLRIK